MVKIETQTPVTVKSVRSKDMEVGKPYVISGHDANFAFTADYKDAVVVKYYTQQIVAFCVSQDIRIYTTEDFGMFWFTPIESVTLTIKR